MLKFNLVLFVKEHTNHMQQRQKMNVNSTTDITISFH